MGTNGDDLTGDRVIAAATEREGRCRVQCQAVVASRPAMEKVGVAEERTDQGGNWVSRSSVVDMARVPPRISPRRAAVPDVCSNGPAPRPRRAVCAGHEAGGGGDRAALSRR